MKTAIIYTILSLVNFSAFVVGILFLPAEVPIHFDATMQADVIGSPWVFAALPAAACLISAGVFTASLRAKKFKRLTEGLLCAIGGALVCLGWTFFSLSASGVKVGERAMFPVLTFTVLPVSMLLIWLGGALPKVNKNPYFGICTNASQKSERVWQKTQKLGGSLFFFSGVLSSVLSILFSCLPALCYYPYLPAIFLCLTAVLSFLIAALYAKGISKGEENL